MFEMSKSVSVIIPVYNVKKYLRECLHSVIHQTYKDLEIILVDDGSTDGSGAICEKYRTKDSRIQVIHQKNQGLSAARNTGLKAMHGEIVAFLDSDDAIMPDMIEKLMNAMKETDADVSACSFYVCPTEKRMNPACATRIWKLENAFISPQESLQSLIEDRINVSVWNKLYKRHLFDEISFPVGRSYEDQLTTPFVLEKARSVVMIEEPLLFYRIRPKSISTTVNEKNTVDWLYAIRVKEDFVEKRSPAIFTAKQKTMLLDRDFHGVLMYYAAVRMNRSGKFSKDLRSTLEQEIKVRSKNISAFSAKSRITYKLYCISPFLCAAVLNCYYNVLSLTDSIRSRFKGRRYE